MLSVRGLNDSEPAPSVGRHPHPLHERLPACHAPPNAKAVVSSGEVTKQCVLTLPSLRLAKLRLYEVTIVLGVPGFMSVLRAWSAPRQRALGRGGAEPTDPTGRCTGRTRWRGPWRQPPGTALVHAGVRLLVCASARAAQPSAAQARTELSVTLNGAANLLGAGSDVERHLEL